MRNLPQRTCIGCNEKKDKSDLIRIVANKQSEIKIDKFGKEEGRGTYICNSINCLEKAIKSKRFQRALRVQKIETDLFENLREKINGGEFIG